MFLFQVESATCTEAAVGHVIAAEADMVSPASVAVCTTEVSAEVSAEANVEASAERMAVITKLTEVAEKAGLSFNVNSLSSTVVSGTTNLQFSKEFKIHDSVCSRKQYYTVFSFLMNGHFYAYYTKLSGWLGLPPCSGTQWRRIIEKLEVHVTRLAEWSCGQVRQAMVAMGDDKKWVASYDGFYLTRGHYSNNASATLHDFHTGAIAYFAHRTKRGAGHNWKGTSAAAEGDMFDDILGKVKADNITIREVITDKDSSVNGIFCRHFPEGTITYCSNHVQRHCTRTCKR